MNRMNIISNLFGSSKEALSLKQDFLKIAVVNSSEAEGQMVRGRGVGKELQRSYKNQPNSEQRGEAEISAIGND